MPSRVKTWEAMAMIGPDDSVLLIVEDAFQYQAKQLRDRSGVRRTAGNDP